MRCSFTAILIVLIGAGVSSGAERNSHVVPSIAASAAALPPAQDDEPRAEIVSGQFIIIRTSETLDCKAGLNWISRLAEAGDPEAMFELGGMYQSGSCTVIDRSKALAWLRKAAASGNTEALGFLGRAYYFGSGLDGANYDNALFWFSRGAERLDARSFYFLGLMYLHGKGVRPDYREAFILLDVSAHLYPLFTEERTAATAARDRAREGLTPAEVADAGLKSKQLLEAMLEHRDQAVADFFPPEARATLQTGRR